MYRLVVTLWLFVGTLTSSALAQTTRVVDGDGQGSATSCDEASAAFVTVGAAIAAAADGDTVLVCPGTYVENINFGTRKLVVRSTGGPAVTILDGNAIDSVVKFTSSWSSTSVLEGFTIQNGRADSRGGGIQISYASAVIRRNVIVGNSACVAAGISIYHASPLIEYNTISNNVVCVGAPEIVGGGIAIVGHSLAIIRHNNIYNHTGITVGGGIALQFAGSPTIESNVIRGNTAEQGGGIGILASSPSIVGNLIVRNQAESGGGIYWGAPGALLVNNTIADNESLNGSAVFSGASATLWNNVIAAAADQTAVFCSNVFWPSEPEPTFRSDDVFSASGAAYGGICTDQTGLNGNISADPMFVQSATSDYHLLSNSPCIDAGDDAATGLPPTDVDGHARVLDGNGDSLGVVDIGADEAPSAGTAPAVFGKINPADAAPAQPIRMLLTWGASPGATAYEYCADKVDNGACDETWVSAWNATSATLFDLEGGTTYYWQVRAINAAGVAYANGGVSAYWSFTTAAFVPTRILELSGDLDFGTLLIGQTATRTLTISNTGNDLLTVSGISYPTGFNSPPWSGTIAAGGSRSVTVYFSPIAQTTYTGTISVSANQTGGTSSIAASGTGLPATRIMSLSGDLVFPDTPPGSMTTRSLTISNRGNDALYVSGFSPPAGFRVSWSGSIAPADSYTVTVTFAPITSTAYAGTLRVFANQTFGSDTVTVSGVGAVPAGAQVIWQHASTGFLDSWYVQGATVTFESPLSISQVADLYWRVVGTGDLNGDGAPDIVWQHVFDGWLAVWFMNGGVVKSTKVLSIERVPDLNWVIRAVGDIDGEGHADLIWQHQRDGWIAAWLMNGARVVSTTLLSIPQIPADWEVAGAGDLDGDGNADLVFQHRTGGWLAAWYLQGPTVTRAELLSVNRMPDLRHLREQGLIETARVPGYRDQAVSLTKDGRSLLETHRDHDHEHLQTFYAGLAREREREHGLQVYRAYEQAEARLREHGAHIERVVLDHELKSGYQRWLHERDRDHDDYDGHPDRTPDEIREWAYEHDLPYFDDEVHFPTFASNTRSRMAVGSARTSRSSHRTIETPSHRRVRGAVARGRRSYAWRLRTDCQALAAPGPFERRGFRIPTIGAGATFALISRDGPMVAAPDQNHSFVNSEHQLDWKIASKNAMNPKTMNPTPAPKPTAKAPYTAISSEAH